MVSRKSSVYELGEAASKHFETLQRNRAMEHGEPIDQNAFDIHGMRFVTAAAMSATQLSTKEITELTKNLNQALAPSERPLGMSRTRELILQTHRTKGASGMWALACRQPLTISRFTAWKFCSLLHKLLRDGHKHTIHDSQRQRDQLNILADYWSRRSDSTIGQCIALYCHVLLAILHLHTTYASSFRYSLMKLPNAELPPLNINICFHLCSDVFDVLEAMLRLQEAVFREIKEHKITPCSPAGHCRLMPLVTIAADCATLHSLSVSWMCALCTQLPAEKMVAFQNRFQTIYEGLRLFYDEMRSHDCVTNVCDIPTLEAKVPNFYKQPQKHQLPTTSALKLEEVFKEPSAQK